jgi:transcriptional regulator with XRE-family HTH domain
METFHLRLRKLRKDKGLTIKSIAQKIGVPETTYREWEYGRSIRGQPYIILAEVLGVSLHELLGGTESKRTEVIEKFQSIKNAISEFEKVLISLL